MLKPKYGKRQHREPIFDLSPWLASSSPEKPAEAHKDIDDLAAQLQQANISDYPQARPIKPKDANIQTPRPNSCERATPRKDVADCTAKHVGKLLELSADPSHRIQPESFSEWSTSLETFFGLLKIAEASYGEVYRLVLKSSHAEFGSSDESVLKILALKPPPQHKSGTNPKARSEKESFMSSVDNVVAEVKLLQRMVDIPGFTNFRDIRVLKGRPSKAFAKAWKAFNAARPKGEKSLFPDPAKKTSYSDDQVWAVIEMQDAGIDLERVQLRTVWTVWDVFWSVTLALAKGEQEAEFEHRDLHMGNICIKTRKENEKVSSPDLAKIRRFKRKFDFSGIETTIIDYTLSRA